MVDINEFIQRMENNYQCSEEFKQRMRQTLQKLEDMESDNATKLALLRNVEETYSRHSNNYTNISNIVNTIAENNKRIEQGLKSREEPENHAHKFDIDMD